MDFAAFPASPGRRKKDYTSKKLMNEKGIYTIQEAFAFAAAAEKVAQMVPSTMK
jgi:hypothetical protein